MTTLNEVTTGDVILLIPGGQYWLVLERFRVVGEQQEIFHLVSEIGVFKVLSHDLDKGDLNLEIW